MRIVNKPLYSGLFISVRQYKPAAKNKPVFIKRILKSAAINFLFSLILLAILMKKKNRR